MDATQDSYALFAAARKQSPNPFSLEHVISANEVWGEVMADLPNLNGHIDQRVNQAITEVRQKFSNKIGLTIKGDKGTGKSHVIHRIWKNIEQEGGAFFSYLPPCSNPNRIDAHVRQSLCADFARQDKHGVTQWQRIAVALISTLTGTEFEKKYQECISKCGQPEQLKHYIISTVEKPRMGDFFDDLTEAILENQSELDFNFLKAVLFTLFKHAKLAQIGLAWLKGDDHPSMRQAGLPEYSAEQQDGKAIWIIQQVCKLTEVISKPVVICFDQIESYSPNSETGDSKAQVVAQCIDRIYFQCSNVILVCCVHSDTWREIFQMQGGIPDRVGHGQWLIDAKPPNADQLIELVKLRLDWFYKKNNLNPDNYDYLYPFDEGELRNIAGEAAAARHIFRKWCAKKFEEDGGKGKTKSKKQELLDIYNELLIKISAPSKNNDSKSDDQLASISDDQLASIIACTMKMLPDTVIEGVIVEKIEKVNASSDHDLHLVISGHKSDSQEKVRIGIRICETTKGLTFNAVMRRLLDYRKHDLTRGCLVRSTPISHKWIKGKELVQELKEQKKGEVVVLKKEELKPLATIEEIYRQSADYGFEKDELIEIVKELKLVEANPLICEILSAPVAV